MSPTLHQRCRTSATMAAIAATAACPARFAFGTRLSASLAMLTALFIGCLASVNMYGAEPRTPAVHLLVQLPLEGDQDLQLQATIERIAEQLRSEPAPNGKRPMLLLEIRQRDSTALFERCLSVARFLAGKRVQGIRTVAYLPEPIDGHGVILALACEELLVGKTAAIGPVSQGADSPDPAVLQSYLDIAARRRLAPESLVRAWVDPQAHIVQAETLDGSRIIDRGELETLQKTVSVTSTTTITREGAAARLDAERLRSLHVASRVIDQPIELEAALGVALQPWLGTPASNRAMQVKLQGALRGQAIQSEMRAIRAAWEQQSLDLVVLHVNSPGGAPQSAARLANLLVEMSLEGVRTVAFVQQQARADAWLPVAACDVIYAQPNASLGGDGAPTFEPREAAALGAVAARIAEQKRRSPSFSAGLIDASVPLFRYENTVNGSRRAFSADEHFARADRDRWEKREPLETEAGVTGQEAMTLGVVADTPIDFATVLQTLGVQGDGMKQNETPWVVDQVERLGGIPWLPQLLLMVAFFALFAEFSAPGLGAPGFTSAICFLLFFWIQSLNGTAGAFELVMFLGGLLCLVVEFFVLPGFGVFGVGGALMVLGSLVLASQTFVLPVNSYQWSQFPSSLSSVAFAIVGVVSGGIVLRHVLPHTPYLKKMMLETEAEPDLPEPYAYLQGKVGVATTMLRPSGKAMFGDDLLDVITSGELVESGQRVVVQVVRGAHITVRKLEDRAAGEDRSGADEQQDPASLPEAGDPRSFLESADPDEWLS